jgi:hypothetical protein
MKLASMCTLIVVFALFLGCETDPGEPATPVGPVPQLATEDPVQYSDWSEPVNLGPVVNSPELDINPSLSADGLRLYFVSQRPGGFGLNDIWVS